MTLHMPSASAASVPTRKGTHSVALAAAKLHSGSTTTIFMPRARASAALAMFEPEAWPAEWPLDAPKKIE